MNANQRFDTNLQKRLDEKKANGLFRQLVCVNDAVDFSSNDYIGFAQLQGLHSIDTSHLPKGATGARLITGNSALAEETENIIAAFHNAASALIFNTGYMANVGLFSCIASKEDTFITDEYIHASVIDGMRLSHAKRYKFRHNDLEDLEKKLQQASGQKFVAIESIYSMDGDEAPLVAIADLCKKHDALLIVDEAHATGVFGEKGEGLVCHYKLENNVYARIYTFGKAVGLHGAAVAGSNTLRNHLINNARSFIFATAMPPHIYVQIQEAYNLLPSANRTDLFALINYFRKKTNDLSGISFLNSHSPIQGIIIGDNFKAKSLSEYLIKNGFFVKAILSPTVPVGTERLRVCLHSFNTKAQVDALFIQIKKHLE